MKTYLITAWILISTNLINCSDYSNPLSAPRKNNLKIDLLTFLDTNVIGKEKWLTKAEISPNTPYTNEKCDYIYYIYAPCSKGQTVTSDGKLILADGTKMPYEGQIKLYLISRNDFTDQRVVTTPYMEFISDAQKSIMRQLNPKSTCDCSCTCS